MGSKFQVGDLVISKLWGQPAWPATINKVEEKKKGNVIFYGT